MEGLQKSLKGEIIKWTMLGAAIILNVWGIISLLYASGIAQLGMVAYLGKVRLIVRYVIVVITMGAGIMLFSAFAAKLKGKAKNALSIGGCVYSTLLTIPLFLTFVLCFFTLGGNTNLPLVGDIAIELADVFKGKGLQIFIYTAGSLMGIIFLAVPIIMTVATVKEVGLVELFKGKKKAELITIEEEIAKKENNQN